MLLSKEFIDFIKHQQSTDSISKISKNINELIETFIDLKRDLSKKLPELFMANNAKAIEEYINYGKEIDSFINSLKEITICNTKKQEPIKITIQENQSITSQQEVKSPTEIQTVKPIKLGVVSENLCPHCNIRLEDSKIMYTTFKDKGKTKLDSKLTVFTYRCKVCGQYFIHEDMLSSIDIKLSNIEPVYYDSKRKAKKCIQCGEPVWNNSNYCWEHYKYHNSESK